MKFYQYEIRSTDLQDVVAVFYVDEEGYIDEANLPSRREISNMLSLILKKELTAVQTGESFDE